MSEEEETKVTLFVGRGEIKRALFYETSFVLRCNGIYLTISDVDNSLPFNVMNLLQECNDLFSEEIPNGLPPIRGIEHRIDFILRSSLLNRAVYRVNLKETKEI